MVSTFQSQFDSIVEHLKEDLASIRTGRVSPALIEQTPIEAYGGTMKLVELGSISSEDARTLVVDAWDKSVMKDIEKGLTQNKIGFSVNNDGNVIRVFFPQLTEESRKEIMKVVNEKHETAKVSLRQLRDKIKEEINSKEKAKEFGEDEKFRYMDELEKKVKDVQERFKAMVEKKEEELKI